MYRIGTYTDQILNGTRISSLGVRGDTASNAWAADAISIANAYDPDTADDIAKVYGYDDAGNIANIKMDSQTRQLRNISKALGQSTRKPAAIQGGANLTTTQSTLTINVPAEGLYYITDSAGNPIMIGTKSGNANIMKNDAKDPQWRTLGTAVVKAKSMRVDKKVQVQRNGTTVGKDGTTNDPVGVTVGDTVTNTVEVTVPNKQAASAVKFKLIDQPKGQTYVKGSLSVRLKNAPRTDITADAIVYDGTTQNNAKSIPGDPTLKTADNRPADPDLAIPAGGWGIDGRNLLDKYSNRTIVITYRMTADEASVTDPANNTIHTYGTFTDGIHFTTITDQDKADIKAFSSPMREQVAEEPLAGLLLVEHAHRVFVDDEPGPRHPFRRLVRHGFRFRIAFLDARGDADEFQIGYPLGHGPVRQTYDDLLSPAIELGQLADAGAVHRFQVFAQFGDPVACESAHAQPLPIH